MNVRGQFNYAVSADLRIYPKLSTAYSWPAIILALIVFWPVGIFLMYKRFSIDKAAALKNSKPVAIISYFLIFLGIGYLITAFSISNMFIPALLFGGGGIYLLVLSKRMKKDGLKSEQYIDLIVNQNQSSIDNIAAAVGVPYDVAKKDLQEMIDSGYFTGAYIRNIEFILPHHNRQPQTHSTSTITQAQVSTKVVVCKSCGANKRIIEDQTCECEYCGSPIQ